MTVRTRFSPSPTGFLHLGNARAALFSALFAKKKQGVFILRIEDTDASRSGEHYINALQEDLVWLGIKWQEGPQVGGNYGPYYQSQRQPIYQEYYTNLETKGLIYPCFCTDQELVLARKVQMASGRPPRYSGKCFTLTKNDIAMRREKGMQPAWRFHVPPDQRITFTDLIKGPQQFNSNDIGDFIVRRADGTAPFLFCNAVDDAKMQVSHVLRGEDHLTNTPRQLLLLKTLDLPVPAYGHLSLIVGQGGAPLSKREGSFSLREMKDKGYLPKAVMNYLARLGHVCEEDILLTFDELAKYFAIEKLSRSSALFDFIQLRHWQKMAVQSLNISEFWQWVGENVQHQVPEMSRNLFHQAIKTNIEFPQDALHWAKVFFQPDIEWQDQEVQVLRAAGSDFFKIAIQQLERHGAQAEPFLAGLQEIVKLNGKKLFMPLRVALTGEARGPEFASIVELLGEEKIKYRLNKAQAVC